MRKINPQYAEAIKRVTNQSPYFRLLSMELRDFDIGTSLLEIVLQEKHLQPFGHVHGGVFSTIIDAATFWAAYGEIDEQSGMTSVELKLNYLAPATAPGRLVARGRRIKLGRTLGLGEAEVTNEEGKIVAHGTSTLMVMQGLRFSEQDLFPPKFIRK